MNCLRVLKILYFKYLFKIELSSSVSDSSVSDSNIFGKNVCIISYSLKWIYHKTKANLRVNVKGVLAKYILML